METTMMPFTIEEKFTVLLQIANTICPEYRPEKLNQKLRVLTQDTVFCYRGKLVFRCYDIKQKYHQLLVIFATYHGKRKSFEKKFINFGKIKVPGRGQVEVEMAMESILVDVLFMDLPDPYPNTTPVVFHNFAKFPPEIRIKIWKVLCETPRLLQVHFNGSDCKPLRHNLFDRRTLANMRPSAILQVNKESREVALKYYEMIVTHPGSDYKPFYFNPRFDTVYFSGTDCGSYMFGWPMYSDVRDGGEIDYLHSDFLERIEYLALPRHAWDDLNLFVAGVPKIKELLLVLGSQNEPDESQGFNYEPGEKPIPPEFLIASLREVADEEMNETEKQLKEDVFDYISAYRSEDYDPDFQDEIPAFPEEDKLVVRFMTVLDEAGNEPTWVTNA